VLGKRVTRAVLVGLAVGGTALLVAAGPAFASTGDVDVANEAPGDLSPAAELTPAGVPVFGLVQSAVGATKALPGTSTAGY